MKYSGVLPGVLLAAALAGCVSSKEDDMRAWMLQERKQTRPHVAPISAPKPFIPEHYANALATEPFSSLQLTQALKQDAAQVTSSGALVAPELARRKEALEAFPLDSMGLVGSIFQAGKPVALVKVDGLLYVVRLGNHLGPNFGRVMKITDTEVTLREVVQDAVGEWMERIATLQLQERSK